MSMKRNCLADKSPGACAGYVWLVTWSEGLCPSQEKWIRKNVGRETIVCSEGWGRNSPLLLWKERSISKSSSAGTMQRFTEDLLWELIRGLLKYVCALNKISSGINTSLSQFILPCQQSTTVYTASQGDSSAWPWTSVLSSLTSDRLTSDINHILVFLCTSVLAKVLQLLLGLHYFVALCF